MALIIDIDADRIERLTAKPPAGDLSLLVVASTADIGNAMGALLAVAYAMLKSGRDGAGDSLLRIAVAMGKGLGMSAEDIIAATRAQRGGE